MDLLRSFISLFNRHGESSSVSSRTNSVDLSIPVCYYGHTYVAQPNSDELKRATFILESRNKNMTKNFPNLLSCHDDCSIILRDQGRQTLCKYEVRKIVVSCVDAKQQRLFAIFYDNDSSESSMGMECHLFLCRTKMVAKMTANKIGDKLNRLRQKPVEVPPEIKLDQVSITMRPNVYDFDYENISKFFREEVFNLSVQEPSSESSSTYLTTGCDSGRASTVASVDTKSEISRDISINPIHEDEEPEVNIPDSFLLNPRVKELLNSEPNHRENNKLKKTSKKNKDPPEYLGKLDVPGEHTINTNTSNNIHNTTQTKNDNDNNNNNDKNKNLNVNTDKGKINRQKRRNKKKLKESKSLNCEDFDEIIEPKKDRYSHQYELTGETDRPELNNNEIYENIWDIRVTLRNDNNINDNNDKTENKLEDEDDQPTYENLARLSLSSITNNANKNINTTTTKQSNTTTKSTGKHKKKRPSDKQHSVDSDSSSFSQNIQNRFSVHYDQQDDDEDVFMSESSEASDTVQPIKSVGFGGLMVNRGDDDSLRKIDRQSLHRLTYLSATDI